ncbi:MAG: hypothetical protein BWY85_01305 [Firmicutes bacterium ADurb.Bin506]|nr:MAG: hypothetical protein BWY85_01305 [Firmicutes bacterium ADurb.Bin506]
MPTAMELTRAVTRFTGRPAHPIRPKFARIVSTMGAMHISESHDRPRLRYTMASTDKAASTRLCIWPVTIWLPMASPSNGRPVISTLSMVGAAAARSLTIALASSSVPPPAREFIVESAMTCMRA